jgi:hypothetical protein
VKRPSKHIKSPYVADIKYGEVEILGNAPALGCCGLSDSGATILMSPSSSEKCSHTIYLSVCKDQVIGIHPKLAEKLRRIIYEFSYKMGVLNEKRCNT